MRLHHHRRSTSGRGRRNILLGGLLAMSVALPALGGAGLSASAAPSASHAADVVDRSNLRGLTNLVAHPDALQTVPDQVKPKIRWWWPSDEINDAEIDAELEAMKAAGFGGVEHVLIGKGETWGTAAFSAHLAHALAKATELGLTFDITLGPGWPTASKAVSDVERELSAQNLHYGTVDVAGGAGYSGPVPDNAPADAPAHKRLIAVTAARVVSTPGATPVVLDPTSMVDLSERVDASGSLSWTAPPEGQWKLFGFWMRPTMQINKTSGPGGALVIDHLSTEAIQATLTEFDGQFFDGVARLLRKNGGDIFEDSLEIEKGHSAAGQSSVVWTKEMLRNFGDRRKYDLTADLPGVFEEFAFPDNADDRLKEDFGTTVTDLLISNHYDPITAWAKKKGLTLRAQAYQAGSGNVGVRDNSRLAAAIPKPDVETMGFGDPSISANIPGQRNHQPGSPQSRAVLDRYRQVVSGAHLSGAPEVSAEWGSSLMGDFRQDPAQIKSMADHAFAAGVTTMVLHGFAYRDNTTPQGPNWPGWCAHCAGPAIGPGLYLTFADSFNQDWPQFDDLIRLSDYTARASAVLRTGAPEVDVAVVNATSHVDGSRAPNPTGTPEDALLAGLSARALTWDAMSPTDLLTTGKVINGRLLPKGPGYRGILVQEQPHMAAATAQRLVTLAKAGLPVVFQGQPPARGAGYRDPAAEDAQLASALDALRALPNVRFTQTPAEAVQALADLGVRPQVSGDRAGDVVPVHRRTASGDVWFLYNNSTTAITTDLTFDTSGAPSVLDLWSGEATALGRYRTAGSGADRTVTVPVTIGADDTTVLLFDETATGKTSVVDTDADSVIREGKTLVVRDATGGPASITLSDGSSRTVNLPTTPAVTTLNGPWHLRVDTVAPTGNETVDLTLPQLTPWSTIPALKGKSGTGTYTTEVNVPAASLGAGHGMNLRLGDFKGAARVWVNDREVAAPSAPTDSDTDVTALLHAGKNTIQVQLSTTLNNAIHTQALTGDPLFARWAARPEIAYGLFGPVMLKPYAEAAVPRPR
jgi:hypothetical protein